MQSEVGKDIELSCFLITVNGKPLAGRTVSVTVLDAKTGSTLLVPSAMTERAPALYGFLWDKNLIPSGEQEMIAKYSYSGFTLSERISRISAQSGAAPDLVAEIEGETLFSEAESNRELSVETESVEISGLAEDEDLSGTLEVKDLDAKTEC